MSTAVDFLKIPLCIKAHRNENNKYDLEIPLQTAEIKYYENLSFDEMLQKVRDLSKITDLSYYSLVIN